MPSRLVIPIFKVTSVLRKTLLLSSLLFRRCHQFEKHTLSCINMNVMIISCFVEIVGNRRKKRKKDANESMLMK